MKIAFIISSLSCGGAEKVISILANHYASTGNDVILLTLAKGSMDFYKVDQRVRRISLDLINDSLGIVSGIANNIKRVRRLRSVILELRPDVIVSFMHRTNITTLMATIGLSVPVIVSERTDTRQWPIGYMWEYLRRYSYPHASAVVVQTESMRKWAAEFIDYDKIFVVPNPVLNVLGNCLSQPPFFVNTPFVAAMGRLVPYKGFDLLLKAFSRCPDRSWSLVIIGDGVERDSLASLAKNLGIADRLYITGNIDQPSAILAHAGIFVLSSRFEGFPNALLEAMSIRLPVVSFDCPSGPREIIEDGVNGLLVPPNDIDRLAKKLELLMEDESLRARLGRQAGHVTERYSISKVAEQWDHLLKKHCRATLRSQA